MRFTRIHRSIVVLGCGGIVTVAGQAQNATAPAVAQSQPAEQSKAIPFTPIPHVEKRGTGPIEMVLIPGLSCDWTVYDAFMRRNESRYTMYAVTLPGFGESEAPATPPGGAADDWSAWLDNADEAIWAVVKERNLKKPVIVGHSMGGHLALRLGTEHADEVQAVISIDGGPAFPLGQDPDAMTKQDRKVMARQMASMYGAIAPEQWETNQRAMVGMMVTDLQRAKELGDLCAKVPSQTTVRYMVELVAADIRDQLPKLTAPTLVVPSAGTTDRVMIESIHTTWINLLKESPNAKLVFFDNTRHFIQDDRPAELDAAVADFLAGREAKGYAIPATQPATQPK